MTSWRFGGRKLTAVLIAAAAVASGAFATVISVATASDAGRPQQRGAHDRDRHRGQESYTVGLFGDMPYGALGRAQYPNLLADMNQDHVAFSICDGDLQAGGDGPCNDSLY